MRIDYIGNELISSVGQYENDLKKKKVNKSRRKQKEWKRINRAKKILKPLKSYLTFVNLMSMLNQKEEKKNADAIEQHQKEKFQIQDKYKINLRWLERLQALQSKEMKGGRREMINMQQQNLQLMTHQTNSNKNRHKLTIWLRDLEKLMTMTLLLDFLMQPMLQLQ